MAEKLIDMAVRLDEESRARHAHMTTYQCCCPHSWNGVLDSIDPACETHKHEAKLEAELATVKAERDRLQGQLAVTVEQREEALDAIRYYSGIVDGETPKQAMERYAAAWSMQDTKRLGETLQLKAELTRLRGEQKGDA